MSTGSESIGGDKNRAYAAAVIVGFLTFLANVSSRRYLVEALTADGGVLGA